MTDAGILHDLVVTLRGVVLAVLPLALVFAALQLAVLDLPKKEIVRVAYGTAIAAAGLFLFLLGVAIGFLPFGRAIGETIGALPSVLGLAAFGAVLGFVTTWGEPAVRILADQVEEASSGSTPRTVVLATIAIGVAAAVALGLLRIAFEIPILWLLVPGYLLVIAALRWSDPSFVAIAIDAGGVATGPLANTFLLALAFGASTAVGVKDPLVHGFGLVALIALAPVISVITLGFLVRRSRSRKESR